MSGWLQGGISAVPKFIYHSINGNLFYQFSRLCVDVNPSGFLFMTITEVKIYPFDSGEPDSSLRAYADVTLEQAILIKGFRVLAAKNGGLFVGFPSKKGKDGKFYDMVEIKSADLQSNLRSAVLEAYKVYS